MRGSTVQLLEGSGYEVVAAADPREALALWAAERELDLLLTDVVLPGMSGGELAARLRRGRAELPVLFISGHTGGEALEDGLAGGETAFLPKPFSREALIREIHRLLGERAAGVRAPRVEVGG